MRHGLQPIVIWMAILILQTLTDPANDDTGTAFGVNTAIDILANDGILSMMAMIDDGDVLYQRNCLVYEVCQFNG